MPRRRSDTVDAGRRRLVVDIDEIERLGVPRRCALFWSYLRMMGDAAPDGRPVFSRREAAKWNLTGHNAIGNLKDALVSEGLISVERPDGPPWRCRYTLNIEIDSHGLAQRTGARER